MHRLSGRQMSLLGQNRKCSLRADDVRSTPESGLKSDIRPCPKRLPAQPVDATQALNLSAGVSTASASKLSGIFMPSDLAVFALMTNSNLVGCITGKSAGLSPFSIRPTYRPDW